MGVHDVYDKQRKGIVLERAAATQVR
ncbi:hypothetical protein LINGRAHAP2_LOCUS16427 [Linum grandiflorum]